MSQAYNLSVFKSELKINLFFQSGLGGLVGKKKKKPFLSILVKLLVEY